MLLQESILEGKRYGTIKLFPTEKSLMVVICQWFPTGLTTTVAKMSQENVTSPVR